MNRNHVAFVAQPFDTLQPLIGGSVGICMYQLASRLAEHHDVTIYCRQTPACVGEKVENSVRFVGVRTRIDSRISKVVKRIEQLLAGSRPESNYLYYTWYYFRWYFYCFYVLAAALRIRRDKPDVVVVPNFSQFVPIIKRVTRRPVVLWMHANWLEELPYRGVARRLKDTAAAVGCCEFVASGVQKRFPDVQDRCFVVYNGFNESTDGRGVLDGKTVSQVREDLEVPGNDKIILFVGRLTPAKGVHVLVDAVRLVLERGIGCTLLVIGGPGGPPNPAWLKSQQSRPEWDELERLRSGYESHLARLSVGFEDRVRFLGKVPHQQLASYYTAADLFVLPSLKNEAFPLVILEAMSYGCPVISTYHAGIPEIVVERETGLLVRPGDREALAEKMVDVLSDPALAKRIGEKGRTRVRMDFTWERSCEAFLKVLEEVADPKEGV